LTELCDPGCFPDYGHNVGVSGDPQGHLIGTQGLVAFGAPWDLGQYNWGQWDLYGGVATLCRLECNPGCGGCNPCSCHCAADPEPAALSTVIESVLED